MFSELVESSSVWQITHKCWAVVLSATGQVILLSALLLIPLIHTQALPKAQSGTYLIAPLPPALQSQFLKTAGTKRGPRLFTGIRLIAPTSIPPNVAVLREPELPLDAGPSLQTNSVFNDLPRLGMTDGHVDPNPIVPSPLKTDQPARLKRGGDVEQALLLSQTRPAYPLLAIQTHTQGDVVLRAIISKDGNVAELQLVAGHPLLVRAAMDAVRQWRYRPTLLNGQPVEVDTTITVTFRLGG